MCSESLTFKKTMTEANEMFETIMRELNNVVISDTEENMEENELERLSCLEEEDFHEDLPPSLLSFFETSRSRAAVCERLILEKAEDFTPSQTEEKMNLPIELDMETVELNEQVICYTEKENNTFTDARPPPGLTETETLSTHNMSECLNTEEEAGTDEYMEREKCLVRDLRILEISLSEEERKENMEFESEREKLHREEMREEERNRQVERDFQEELKKLLETEKLQQKELELMGKRAQDKLEQEMLLQQEVLSDLQKRVERERQTMEVEKKKRIRDKEKMKMGAEKKRMEEEREEMKVKHEKERKNAEEENRKKDLEQRKQIEVEMRMMREKEEKKKKKEEQRMNEEKREKMEEARKKTEREKREMEEERRRMEEEKERKQREDEVMRVEEERRITQEIDRRRKEDEKIKMEAEIKRMGEETRREKEEQRRIELEMKMKKEREEKKTKEEEQRRNQEERERTETEDRKKRKEIRKNTEEEAADDGKTMARKDKNEEMSKPQNRGQANVDENITNEQLKFEERKLQEENDRKTSEEDENKLAEKKETGRNKMEEKELVNRKMTDKLPSIKDYDRGNSKESQRRRQWYDEDTGKSGGETQLEGDKEGDTGYEIDDRKMEHEKDDSKSHEEKELEKEEENVQAEHLQNGEEVGENTGEVKKNPEEEVRLNQKKESYRRMAQDGEMEVNVVRAKSENNCIIGENEKNNMDKTENSQASQLQDSTTWTSSSPVPSHRQPTVSPTSTETNPQQQLYPGQTSIHETVECGHPAARPVSSTASVVLPLSLPEQTEQKRLSWMNECVPWSKLSHQNKRKQKGDVCVRGRRGARRAAAEANSLPPLCPDSLLRSARCKSLQEVTTVTLEDLPGCSLSTLSQCTQLRSLTLRRCGLKLLEGINQLTQLSYIDVQENEISFVDCENMTSLRVLHLAHNSLTSIHGLTGAPNVDVLDLSHNSITRIAGLESMKRLQRLSVDHNQLISTKGLKDVYTLLHLSCSHNHLANVEGLENNALLNTLDLSANNLTEAPSLNNQVLLRVLHLHDNSISSLQGLTACWLPLMTHLSLAKNRITQLPSMSDCVSLANLDLQFNCLSELQNLCESLEGSQFLREVLLTGNPLQEENGWRSTLQRAVPGLSSINDQQTDSSLSPPAVHQVGSASGSGFITFCQDQLQQTLDLQQRHNRELSNASSSLDALKASCRHFTEVLQLATDQRLAHEYGDTAVSDKHSAAGRTTPEELLDTDIRNAEKSQEIDPNGEVPPVTIRCSNWTVQEKFATESRHCTLDSVTPRTQIGPTTVSKANSGSVHFLAAKGKTTSSSVEMMPVSEREDLDHQNTAAVVIQQLWRNYRQKCRTISGLSTAEKGGRDGGKPESGAHYVNGRVVRKDHAATVIQALWRGYALRRRLSSALAAVTSPDTGEEDTFEELDVEEFVFDEAALEKPWTLPLVAEDSAPRSYPLSLSLKPLEPFPEPSQYVLPPPPVWRSKQAWVAGEEVDTASQTVSPLISNRSESPASNSVRSGLSQKSEKIREEWGFAHSHTALLMLKRAQKMKSSTQQQKKRRDPSVRLALFRKFSYQQGPVEARTRQAQHNRNDIKVCEAETGLQQAEKTERVKQEPAAHSDRDPESVRFLPEISSDVLNGGRVQLVANPGYPERRDHASGSRANSSLASQPSKENNYLRRNSLGHASREVLSPKRVSSAPIKKERMSHRDNPVQMSGGWGGGKKRDKVYK